MDMLLTTGEQVSIALLTMAFRSLGQKAVSLSAQYPPVAQLDNAADSDSEDRGFESLWAGQKGCIKKMPPP